MSSEQPRRTPCTPQTCHSERNAHMQTQRIQLYASVLHKAVQLHGSIATCIAIVLALFQCFGGAAVGAVARSSYWHRTTCRCLHLGPVCMCKVWQARGAKTCPMFMCGPQSHNGDAVQSVLASAACRFAVSPLLSDFACGSPLCGSSAGMSLVFAVVLMIGSSWARIGSIL